MGAPVPVPGQIAPVIPTPMPPELVQGPPPPPMPTMGEAPPPMMGAPPPPHVRRLMGKRAAHPFETVGRSRPSALTE
jgi:hypothetical protein